MQLQDRFSVVESQDSPEPTAAQRLLADVEGLAGEITARAGEIEAGRRVPLDLVDTLRSIGVFRMMTPRSHGGLELDLPSALEVVGALARIEGSVGWIAMIGGVSPIFMPMLPRQLYDQAYKDGPDLITAGSLQPAGTAEAVAGGFRVNGRWAFASGCEHADWMIGPCVMTKGGKAIPASANPTSHGEAGPPMVRAVVLPARDWQIEDTWHVAGLKGTGSHHAVLKDIVVPAEHFIDLEGAEPCVPGPLYQAVRLILPLAHGAFCVGMAQGALSDLVALANTGRQQQRAAVRMRDSEIFQYELGRIEADVMAARAFQEVLVASHWRRALAGTLNDPALPVEGAQAAAWLAATCVRVADACFALGGGAALYESSPVQRRLRDLHAAGQHAAVHPRAYAGAGKMRLDGASVATPPG